MSNYIFKWKKYLKESVEAAEAEVQAAKAELEAVSKYAEMLKKNAQIKLGQTEAKVQAEKAKEQQERTLEKVQQSSEPAITGTTSTTATKMEEDIRNTNAMGTTSATSVGNTPGDTPDKENTIGPKNLALDEEELTEEEIEEAYGYHEGVDESGKPYNLELEYQEIEEENKCNECNQCMMSNLLTEAKYKGRTVPLGKPMRGDVKKFKVFVRDPSTGNIKKVNFGDKKMRIKKSNPKRRKSFRARHRCANPGPRTKARYWSCRKW
jgi:hypothetical protein